MNATNRTPTPIMAKMLRDEAVCVLPCDVLCVTEKSLEVSARDTR